MYSDYSLEEITEKLALPDYYQNFRDLQLKGSQIIEKINDTIEKDILDNDILDLISKILSIIEDNIEYLSAKQIFSDDLAKACAIINTATDIYFNALSILVNQKIEENDRSNLIQKIQYDIKIFCSSLTVFSNVFDEITAEISELIYTKHEEKLINLNLRLGLECSLFNFCVKVDKSEYFPYFKSKFVQVYNFRDKINSTSDKIALFKSFSGTGKNICFPLFLFSRSLKDNINSPVVLMTMLTPYHAEQKKEQFETYFSKYVKITNDSNKLSQNFNDEQKQQMTLGILTTYSLLPLMNKYKNNPEFLNRTRFIINDLHQKSFHISVIVSQIIELYNNNSLKLSLNVIMLSSFFPPEIENIFKNIASITSLLSQPQYPITDYIYKYQNQARIEIKIQKAIKRVIYQMARLNNDSGKIEEGHIICFLPNTFLCNQIRKMIVSDTKFSNSKTTKKIIILKTFLKPNEDQYNFMNRIATDYEYCKSKEQNNDYIYFLPLVISGVTSKAINSIVSKKFPPELTGINKLIFGTTFLESLNIEDVSAVVDSGLFEDRIFNPYNGITSNVQKNCSEASNELRKGRLGLTMNGLYCTFSKDAKDDKIHEPDVLERDITNNFLSMKRINIDFENLTNLPYKAKKENLEYSINLLTQYGLINNNNENGIKPLEITDFDINELGLDFSIPFYYIAAIIKYSKSFTNENDRNYAYLIASYISLIIIFSKCLIKDEISEELAKYHDENSDIVTLFNALNELISIKIDERKKTTTNQPTNNQSTFNQSTNNQSTNNQSTTNQSTNNQSTTNQSTTNQSTTNQPRSNESAPNKPRSNKSTPNQSNPNQQRPRGQKSKRENFKNSGKDELKRCFAQLEVTKIIDKIKKIAKHLFGNENFDTVFTGLRDFADKKGIDNIIDNFIDNIEIKLNNEAENKWEKIHSFEFQGLRNIKTDRNPELIFLGANELKVNEKQTNGKIFIIKRPGMKGLTTPSQIYCFNIECKIENNNYKKLIGHIIHKKKPYTTVNSTIEIDNTNVLNPWFNVLLDIYFNRNDDNKKVKFYYTTLGEKVFLSFNNNNNNDNNNYSIDEIKEGVNKCLDILPYTPRSVLIYKSDLDVVVQVRSLGSNDYLSEDSTNCYCEILNRELIDQLCTDISDLKLSYPSSAICSLFIDETCKINELDRDNLYVVYCKHFTDKQNVIKIVQSKTSQMKNKMKLYVQNSAKEGLFQFPKKLVHPSLIYCEEPKRSILNWLKKYWDSTHKNDNNNNNNNANNNNDNNNTNNNIANNNNEDDNNKTNNNNDNNDNNNNANNNNDNNNTNNNIANNNNDDGNNKTNNNNDNNNIANNNNDNNNTDNNNDKNNTNNNNDKSNHKSTKKDFEVVGHKFKMTLFEIQKLQDYLFLHDTNEIKKEMNLQYEAISFPVELQNKIKNEKWRINKKFNTIIAPIEEVEEVKKTIDEIKEQYNQKNNHSLLRKNKIDPVYCIYACDQQELTEFPLTIICKDGIGPLKVCKYCIMDSLKLALQGLYSNGINIEALEKINTKPECVLNIPSHTYNSNKLRYPLIPIGQLILVLFNFRDDELSSLASGLLQTICEFTIRFRMKEVFTFCPNHPHRIYRVKDYPNEEIECCDDNCDCIYCHKCHLMHNKNFDCTVRELPTGERLCPNCNTPIKKDGGCNTVKCRCGAEFCYQCGMNLTTDVVAGIHLISGHRNSQYNFDNERED